MWLIADFAFPTGEIVVGLLGPLFAPWEDIQLLCENQHLFKTCKDHQNVCLKSTEITYCGDLCKEVLGSRCK